MHLRAVFPELFFERSADPAAILTLFFMLLMRLSSSSIFGGRHMIESTERLGEIAVIRKTAAFTDLLCSAVRMKQKIGCLPQSVFQ